MIQFIIAPHFINNYNSFLDKSHVKKRWQRKEFFGEPEKALKVFFIDQIHDVKSKSTEVKNNFKAPENYWFSSSISAALKIGKKSSCKFSSV